MFCTNLCSVVLYCMHELPIWRIPARNLHVVSLSLPNTPMKKFPLWVIENVQVKQNKRLTDFNTFGRRYTQSGAVKAGSTEIHRKLIGMSGSVSIGQVKQMPVTPQKTPEVQIPDPWGILVINGNSLSPNWLSRQIGLNLLWLYSTVRFTIMVASSSWSRFSEP